MAEDSAGGFRFRICRGEGCRNGTTMVGGVCSLCRREKGLDFFEPPNRFSQKTVGVVASPPLHIDKMAPERAK